MRRLLLVSLVLAMSSAPVASATKPSSLGTCGFGLVPDLRPDSPPGTEYALLSAGPIFQSGTVTCILKVGWGITHSSTSVEGATASATGTLVTVLPPTLVSFTAPPAIDWWLCDSFTDAENVTWYFDGRDHSYTTDDQVPCRNTATPG